MEEINQRSKRDRKPRRPFDAQNDQLDLYHKHNYARSVSPHLQQARNSAPQLHVEAKLLLKFVNAINKNAREWLAQQRHRQIQNIKEPQISKQHKGDHNREAIQLARRHKEHQNKIQSVRQQTQRARPTQAFLKQIKSITLQSAANMINLQMTAARISQHPKNSMNQQIPSNLSFPQQNGKTHQQKIKQNLNFPNHKAHQPVCQFFGREGQKARRVRQVEEKLGLPRPDLMAHKVFKRSAYHVAIAYHIYLKKLSQKGPLGPQAKEVDPTYYARRLKEDFSRQ